MVGAVRANRSLSPAPSLGRQKAGNGSRGMPPATKGIGLQGGGREGQGILKC